MPVWVQIVLTVMVPLEAVVIGYLLTSHKEKGQRRRVEHEQTADAAAKEHQADLDAEDRFIGRLMNRVAELENREAVRITDAIARTERIARLEAQVEALKYELAGKINAAMSVVEQKAAVVLSEAIKKEGQA